MLNSEQLLHYIWKFKLFPADSLVTSDGVKIEVIDPGTHNDNAGPDFFNSKIKAEGKVWAGNVEIHNSSGEWVQHGHDKDKSYNSVILHVAVDVDMEIRNEMGRKIPQCKITVPEKLKKNADYLISSKCNVPCKSSLYALPRPMLNSWTDTLAIERLERKSNDIFAHLKRFDNSWDEVFYVMLSRNFGFGINSDEFERLALSLPLKYILKHRDDIFQIEAMMFGQAGQLNQEIKSVEDNDDNSYYTKLRTEYLFLKGKYGLKSMDSYLFKKMRIRPSSFPEVRIAQLAALLHKWGRLFSKIIKEENYKEIIPYLKVAPSEFWNTHSSLLNKSVNSVKILGNSSLDIIMINSVAPTLFAFGLKTGNDEYCKRALNVLETIRPENNSIVREFKEGGIVPKNAFESQALIQLRREYCDKRKCLYCRIGFRLLTTSLS